MSVAVVYSRAQFGMETPRVAVEVHLAKGLPRFTIVGLPEAVVRESKDRVRSAILNSELSFPNQRITVNLAPADLPKDGGRFDLPIAIGILIATGQLNTHHNLELLELAGELSLTGELKPFFGVLPFVLQATKEKKISIIPAGSVPVIGSLKLGTVHIAQTLSEVYLFLKQALTLPIVSPSTVPNIPKSGTDLSDIKGQLIAKKALEIAAAGGHHLLLIGPPGSGKTLLASCLPSILPTLSEAEAIEVATLAGIRGQTFSESSFFIPPFREPHHTASSTALVGGGTRALPGEISLAHKGVLFLDELPEFNRSALEVLREPLESGHITIARAHRIMSYPAEFQLIAAMNPCPCGYLNAQNKACSCTPPQIQRYRNKLSGPLLDRLDLSIVVQDLPLADLLSSSTTQETSHEVKQRVLQARTLQQERTQCLNQRLTPEQVTRHCTLDPKTQHFLINTLTQRKCSARAFHRILRLGRTIADLDQAKHIEIPHLSLALQMRQLDLM